MKNSLLAIALAAIGLGNWACSGTLPGVRRNVRIVSPSEPTAVEAPPSDAALPEASASYEVPAAGDSFAPTEMPARATVGTPLSVPVPAPRFVEPVASTADPSARDQQLAILTEAVTALRQEIARSYAHSQELVEETKRLRVQIRNFQRDVSKRDAENKVLRNQIRALERRLREVRVPPPVAAAPPPPPPPEAPPPEAPPPEAPPPAAEAPVGEEPATATIEIPPSVEASE